MPRELRDLENGAEDGDERKKVEGRRNEDEEVDEGKKKTFGESKKASAAASQASRLQEENGNESWKVQQKQE